jgi:hypothetical protein
MRKTPVVLGTLAIIFGSLTAAWSLLYMFVGSLIGKMLDLLRALPGDNAVHVEATEAIVRVQEPFWRVSYAVYLVMSVALATIGVGLYRRRSWARTAGVRWAMVAILCCVVMAIAQIAYLQPHMREANRAVYAAHGLAEPMDLPPLAQAMSVVIGQLLYAAFPTVLLALLGRRSAARDFVQA